MKYGLRSSRSHFCNFPTFVTRREPLKKCEELHFDEFFHSLFTKILTGNGSWLRLTMSSGTFVDRIDPFAKRSLKKKQKKSQGSSRYRTGGDVELTALPLLKGKTKNIFLQIYVNLPVVSGYFVIWYVFLSIDPTLLMCLAAVIVWLEIIYNVKQF